jgi:cystathionine beta-lyase/cystathionine gamma-synthase
MDEARRAAIIARTREILQRHSERRSDVPPPIEDENNFAYDELREARQRTVREAEERQQRERHEADRQFWEAVDAKIAAALDAERTFISNVMCDTIAAITTITDATSAKFVELDVKLDGLAKLLQQLREGNERSHALARARAAAEVLDVTLSPKDIN